MIEINGLAHVMLTVSDWPRCQPFYEGLLAFMSMTPVFEGEDMIYYIGGRTAIGVSRCDAAYEGGRFVQNSIGLHHLCFRARSREDVDAVHAYLQSTGACIVHPPEEGGWAPGYYSVLFEDPIGTRLEVNYVPGKGVLARGVQFEPGDDYR